MLSVLGRYGLGDDSALLGNLRRHGVVIVKDVLSRDDSNKCLEALQRLRRRRRRAAGSSRSRSAHDGDDGGNDDDSKAWPTSPVPCFEPTKGRHHYNMLALPSSERISTGSRRAA